MSCRYPRSFSLQMRDGTDLGTEVTKTGAGHYLKLLYLIQLHVCPITLTHLFLFVLCFASL